MDGVLAVASSKGGVGKTTTIVMLAEYFRKRGSVALLDADPNQKLISWLGDEKGESRVEGIALVSLLGRNIVETITEAKAQHDVVIVDFAGALTQEMVFGFGYASAVVIPSGSSKGDIDEARKTFQVVEQTTALLSAGNPSFSLPAKVLLCKVRPNTDTYKAAKQQLAAWKVPVFGDDVHVPHRTSFEKAWWHKCSPQEVADKALKKQIDSVCTAIASLAGLAPPEAKPTKGRVPRAKKAASAATPA
ncbi:ParA family protein [Azospirillum himalayense]|uniref:ParA family protein n=1 Tax=Azospirillum himalayense TaxID=654847 RepID=A0ABW0GC86_9PROT